MTKNKTTQFFAISSKSKAPERIPYEVWANSQLSIAKYYGGCEINGQFYVLDYENCPKKTVGDEVKYFPDLIKHKDVKSNARKNRDFWLKLTIE